LSNSDIFLLLLNNTSRLLRTQFQVHGNNLSSTMAHIYKTKSDSNFNQNLTGSEINLTDDIQIAQARRVENFFISFFNIIFIYNRHNHYLPFLSKNQQKKMMIVVLKLYL